MTENEVIKYLEKHGYVADEVKDMVIQALEKQIPKKPFLSGDGEWDGHIVYDTYECPNCGKQYELEFEEYDYCPNCGQHILIVLEEGAE